MALDRRLGWQGGDLVCVGPNNVSISKPDVIQSIYGVGKALSRQATRRGDEWRWLIPVTVRLLHLVAEHRQWSSRYLNGLHCRLVSTRCNETPNRLHTRYQHW